MEDFVFFLGQFFEAFAQTAPKTTTSTDTFKGGGGDFGGGGASGSW